MQISNLCGPPNNIIYRLEYCLSHVCDLHLYRKYLLACIFLYFLFNRLCASQRAKNLNSPSLFTFNFQKMKNYLKKEIEKMITSWVDSKISKLIHWKLQHKW